MTAKPIAVIINDIHYNLNTLPVADAAMRKAVAKANELKVTLIVAGDLHDTKANMRAECINAMISTFKLCDSPPYFLVGNHDKTNERDSKHALNFLHQFGPVIDRPVKDSKLGFYLVPYNHDPEELKSYLKTLPARSRLIMHQGIQGSNAGDYIQDKSAITAEDVSGMRVISGHYHSRQDIKLPDEGLWTYTGNPYTLNFAEAEDPEKGFHVLMSDGSLQFIPTNLRKHVVISVNCDYNLIVQYNMNSKVKPSDLVKVNLIGTKEQVSKYTKERIIKDFRLVQSFRLETTITDISNRAIADKPQSQSELLDSIIDSKGFTPECIGRLKQKWRDLCE